MTQKRKVYSNQNVALVGSLQNYLELHNIKADIRNLYTSGVMGEVAFFDAWPELWVLDQDYSEALRVIQQVESTQTDTSQDQQWFCKHCGESNPASFELCWQCREVK